MKRPSHFNLLWVFIALMGASSLALPPSLLAQNEVIEEQDDGEEEQDEGHEEDDEDTEEWSVGQVRQFLQKHLPEGLEMLDHVKQEESLDDYLGALERAEDFVYEYHEILDHDGPEEAKAYLHRERLELQIEKLGVRWHDARNQQERERLRIELKAKVTELFDVELAGSRSELKALESEVAAIQAEIVELETHREAFIARELAVILEEDDEEEEDEDDDE